MRDVVALVVYARTSTVGCRVARATEFQCTHQSTHVRVYMECSSLAGRGRQGAEGCWRCTSQRYNRTSHVLHSTHPRACVDRLTIIIVRGCGCCASRNTINQAPNHLLIHRASYTRPNLPPPLPLSAPNHLSASDRQMSNNPEWQSYALFDIYRETQRH